MTKAVALNLHLPLTEKEVKRISEKIPKSAPLLRAVSQAAVAEFEKQNLHYRTLKKTPKPQYIIVSFIPTQGSLSPVANLFLICTGTWRRV